ncbi:hypothetical protein ON010_g19078 [Phytophthora cinnamomi]|nr:hypothetical protein ON010_g19078 [Phytophthora cinnamomi]
MTVRSPLIHVSAAPTPMRHRHRRHRSSMDRLRRTTRGATPSRWLWRCRGRHGSGHRQSPRCLLQGTLRGREPRVPFRLVCAGAQEGAAPLHLDGCVIHDLSAPPGGSVNDHTNSAASPDATWDIFDSIAQRVRDLHRRYPGYAIYAMVADIADAFHHVPVHADHASAFGGRMPRSHIGIVSGMAGFGWTSPPDFFAVFG